MLIFYLCASYLSDQRSLILKIFIVCDGKLSVGCIQTIYTYLLPPQVWGRLWRGWRFLWFHLLPSIHWLASRQFLKWSKFEVIYASVVPRVTNPHWVNPSQLFSEWSKYFQQEVIFFVIVYVLIIFRLLIKESGQGEKISIGYTTWFFCVSFK